MREDFLPPISESPSSKTPFGRGKKKGKQTIRGDEVDSPAAMEKPWPLKNSRQEDLGIVQVAPNISEDVTLSVVTSFILWGSQILWGSPSRNRVRLCLSLHFVFSALLRV